MNRFLFKKIYIKLSGRVLPGVLSAILLLCLLQSCFTGIESTPKITYKDVRKQVVTTPEHQFAQKFIPDSFSCWQPGRLFVVVDPKVNLSYLPPVGKLSEVELTDTLIFRGLRGVNTFTGGEVGELIFTLKRNPTDTVFYRTGIDIAELVKRYELQLPYLVDVTAVAEARQQLVGKEFYTRTERWYSGGFTEIAGRKFLKVKITDVLPGNEQYPYLVKFRSAENQNEKGEPQATNIEAEVEGGVLMAPTQREGAPSLRGFENLFLIDNPRLNYPQISDLHWEQICRGKVETGMTTQEAQLALGSPKEIDRRPDQSILYERWSYPGGIFLIFEDGILTRTNL